MGLKRGGDHPRTMAVQHPHLALFKMQQFGPDEKMEKGVADIGQHQRRQALDLNLLKPLRRHAQGVGRGRRSAGLETETGQISRFFHLAPWGESSIT